MATRDQFIDALFDGRYRIQRRIGAGGMATVYLAEDEELGRRVAVKILSDRYADDAAFIERFRREAQSAAALSHPNIVSVYDRGETDGHAFIVMEYVEGRSLKDLITTRGPLPVTKAIDYAQQILSALRFAHRNGIVHRDIKPHNILIGQEERLKVADFGIARAGASQMTETGSIMGTAQYLSPEQARGQGATAPSDLYSAGIVLYEMLTGRVPYNGDSPVEVALKHVNETPRPPSAYVPGIPRELDQIVLRAMAKDPIDRYRSADDFAEDLRRVLAGLPVAPETTDAATQVLTGGTAATQVLSTPPRPAPRPPAPPRRPPPDYTPRERPRRRRRSIFPWLLVIGLLAAAAAAGWYVYGQIRDELRAAEPVAVPYVVGIGKDRAVEKIEEIGLVPDVREEATTEQPAGKVFRQEPEEGTRVAKGETVVLFVSLGPPKVEVPRLAGLTYDEAAQILAEAKLIPDRRDVFSRQPAGVVVSQEPKPGEEVEEGATILVRVSKGERTVPVPDVLGQTQESADAELRAADFEVNVVPVESDQPVGIVVAQDPEPAADAPKGSTVTISVSLGPPEPETFPVPDVLGFFRDDAAAELEAAGFVPNVTEQETTDQTQDQLVIGQDPPGGVELEPGATVTIIVGVFVEPPPEGGQG
jgi:serine/threonine-protein kinase